MAEYKTIKEHEELLAERGYLSEEFKTMSSVYYWLKEFKDLYDIALYNATVNDEKVKFEIETWAKFNFKLDNVHFKLAYEYDPKEQALRLHTMRARMDNISVTHFLHKSSDLPEAQGIHLSLAEKYKIKNAHKLFDRFKPRSKSLYNSI